MRLLDDSQPAHDTPHPSTTAMTPTAGSSGSGSDGAAPIAEGLWASVTDLMGYGGGRKGEGALNHLQTAGEAERVHVFSLATGHLYERFLKVRGAVFRQVSGSTFAE